MKKLKKLKISLAILLLVFLFIQIYRPNIPIEHHTGDTPILFSNQVDAILKKSCYDCHSNQTDLKWFDQITPVNFLIADHIKKGRSGLNFSDWNSISRPDQNAKLWEAVNQIIQGAMPLKSYTLLHSEAKLSVKDIQVLKDYLSSIAPKQIPDTAKANALDRQYKKWTVEKPAAEFKALPVDINGITFIPDYKNWVPISSTQREDNGTMRIIFGNDIAIKAIKEHQTNPWPNGTILAKVAWDQLTDNRGNITPGVFKQVEYMIKDDHKYRSTAGWGWARFKTPKFEPYGKTPSFTTECINCHRPMENNDFVFTPPLEH